MSIDEPEQVTPAELLALREASWSRKLSAVSLVAECPVDSELTEQTLGVLGRLYRLRRKRGDQAVFLRRWPAVQVLSTVGVASDHYEHGAFWPYLARVAGVDQDQQFQREWGQAFLSNLESLGLPTFSASDDAGTAYVGRILLHSGVPTYCLSDYYRLVEERRRIKPGLEPEALVAWAVDANLPQIDKPVSRFLKYGDEFAVDVTDRVFELLDLARAGNDLSTVPLPGRFLAAARRYAEDGELTRQIAGRRGAGSSPDTRPALRLDPYGRGLLLRLPAVSEAPDGAASWLVSIDGRAQRIQTRALWPGSGEPAPQTELSIASPARTATAALEGHENLEATVPIVDDKDPLLAFDEQGQRLSPGIPWKGVATWLLFPGSRDSLLADGELEVLTEASMPPGWSGWSLVLANLSGVKALRAGEAGRRHTIQAFSSARISVDDPVRGVRTRTGEPVFAQKPSLTLPQEFGAEVSWELTVTDGRGEVLLRRTLTGDGAVDDVWSDLPGPWLGHFTIRLRGPWGRGATRTVFVAEGLDVRYAPGWRRMDGRGLVPVQVHVATASGIHVDRPSFDLAPSETQASVTLTAANHAALLTIEPPHLSLSYLSAGYLLGPTVRPLSLYSEPVVDEPGVLTVDVGTAAEPLLHLMEREEHLQVISPSGLARGGVYRFNLAKIVDTLRARPYARLTLDSEGQMEVATFRPQRLFSDIALHEGRLVLADCVPVDGLMALVYAQRAPWRPPWRLPVNDGAAMLPELLNEAGPLLVTVRLEDPWVPEPVPHWPTKATRVPAEGYLCSEDPDETALSAFLADAAPLVGDVDPARAWAVVCRANRLWLPDFRTVVRELSQRLREHPEQALAGLAGSNADADAVPAALVRTGLAAVGCSPGRSMGDLDWTRRGVLPSILRWRGLADAMRSEALDLAATVCGDVVFDLAEGRDPSPAVGRFDESADRYDQLDPQTRAIFRAQAALVPSGLLDADSRALAALRLLETRRDHDLGRLVPRANNLLTELSRLFALIEDPDARAAVKARTHPTDPGGWRAAPALSMGFALAARHAARGNTLAQGWIEHQRNAWAQLADASPELTTIDLVIAELMIAHRLDHPQEEAP